MVHACESRKASVSVAWISQNALVLVCSVSYVNVFLARKFIHVHHHDVIVTSHYTSGRKIHFIFGMYLPC
jgi:predicted HNH restriction endonuclease